MSGCPPLNVIENFAAGPSAEPEFAAHVQTCEDCKARLAEVRQNNELFTEVASLATTPRSRPPQTTLEVEGYDLLGPLGNGVQGLVYKAVQRKTRRPVAIKFLKGGQFATPRQRGRFDREVELAAGLRHPHIVTVFDSGTTGTGRLYYVMEFVAGEPLDEHLARLAAEAGGPVTIRDTLRLFGKIGSAVEYAHLHGVIHRDLKPANILVDASGEPRIVDFGLAKLSGTSRPGDAPTMTRSGEFAGTFAYASPEQSLGDSAGVDARCDVYSLGVILYEMLTGELPYSTQGPLSEVLHAIAETPPRPPSGLRAEIDPELETILLKALAKEPGRRYQSAGHLTRDLERYLANEPIDAKRDSAWYVLRKSLRRYRLPLAGAGAFVLLLSVFSVVMTLLYQRSVQLERSATESAVSLARLLSEGNVEQGRVAALLGNVDRSEQLLWREFLTHRRAGDVAQAELNDPPGPPAAYWALWELYRRHPCRRSVSLPPAGLYKLRAGSPGRGVWALTTEGQVFEVPTVGPPLEGSRSLPPGPGIAESIDLAGETTLTIEDERLKLRRRGTRTLLLDRPGSLYIGAGGLSLAADGGSFAQVVDGTAIVVSLDRPDQELRFDCEEFVTAVALSRDGRLAARGRNGGLYIWDIATRQLVYEFLDESTGPDLRWPNGALEFSTDGLRLVDLWMNIAGRVVNFDTTPPTVVTLVDRPGDARTLSISPDGLRLAVGDLSGTLRIFDARSGARLDAIAASPTRLHSVVYTPDGGGVWTADDRGLRLWDTTRESGARVVRAAGDLFHAVDFSGDARELVAGGLYGKLHRVNWDDLGGTTLDFGNTQTISSVAVSHDGRYTAAGSYGGLAAVWDARAPTAGPLRLAHANRVSKLCFSQDATRLLTTCDDGSLRLWRMPDGELEAEIEVRADRVPDVAIDPAGRHIAAVTRIGGLLVWTAGPEGAWNDASRAVWQESTQSALRAVRFSPDGMWLAAAGAERTVDVWEVATGRRVARLAGHSQEIYTLAFSPDGAMIASGDSRGAIRLWGTASGAPLATLDGHEGAVMSVRFSPDGRRLASASLDGTLRLWDLEYYGRHVAGNLAVQLQRTGLAESDPLRARAWLEWAAAHGGSGELPAVAPRDAESAAAEPAGGVSTEPAGRHRPAGW